VEAALDQIGPGHREVLWLIGHDGLTVREAAAALGISTGTFRVRLLRARRALRAALDNASPATSARSPFAQEA
jgi:RNA polymerase sigma-70 factor (ECF subfamily)